MGANLYSLRTFTSSSVTFDRGLLQNGLPEASRLCLCLLVRLLFSMSMLFSWFASRASCAIVSIAVVFAGLALVRGSVVSVFLGHVSYDQ